MKTQLAEGGVKTVVFDLMAIFTTNVVDSTTKEK